MNLSDVNEWIHDEVVSLLNTTSLVNPATPSQHVGLAERRDETGHGPYPYVAIQKLTSVPESQGLGNGRLFVDDLSYTNGVLDSITFGEEIEYRLELHVLTDGDERLRDDLGEQLAHHFRLFARTDGQLTGPNLPADIDPIEVTEATPSGRVEDFVRGDGVTLTVPYTRYSTESDPTVADIVNLGVDVATALGGDTIENWGDGEWGDGSWYDEVDAYDTTV